jgi:hypothetical protein
LIDREEFETEGEWSGDICLRGGVRDITRERGGDSVESAGLWYEEGDSDIYKEVVRALRIEPAIEGTGLAEVDLDIARLFCLATGGMRVLEVECITFEVELLGSKRGKL